MLIYTKRPSRDDSVPTATVIQPVPAGLEISELHHVLGLYESGLVSIEIVIAVLRGRIFPVVRVLFVLLVLAGGLSACTDGDTGQYQFASDQPEASAQPSPTMVIPPATFASPIAMVTPRPLGELLSPRWGPSRIYFAAGNDVWTLELASASPVKIFTAPGNSSLAGMASSPSGDRIAVLTNGAETGSAISVLAAAGQPLATRNQINFNSATAQPTTNQSPRVLTAVTGIDWSPQGDRLLLSLSNGGLASLPITLAGEPVPILSPAARLIPFAASWSPTGAQVAFVSPSGPGGPIGLYVAGAIGTPAPPAAVQPRMGQTINSFRWMPDGRSVLFTESDASPLHTSNTDLWQFGANGERKLIASAGSAAPVADIALFNPSPDGSVVAYTVQTAGNIPGSFHSLWIRELVSGKSYQIKTPQGIDITEIWWTADGLVYRAQNSLSNLPGSFNLYRVTRTNESELILKATVIATPGPAATPGSVATPGT